MTNTVTIIDVDFVLFILQTQSLEFSLPNKIFSIFYILNINVKPLIRAQRSKPDIVNP